MMQGSHQGSSVGADGSSPRSHDARNQQGQTGGTVNMNDVLPDPSSSPLLSQTSLRHPASAGPHQTTFGGAGGTLQSISHSFSYGPVSSSGTDFLSPDIGATNLRRAKSDSLRGHRQVRSEDLRYSSPGASAGLYPPPSSSTQEFIRAAASSSRQFLHPSEALPSITRGHHRRSSSGSRERSLGGWSSTSSARASPYPSPSASPRPGYGALPPGGALSDMQFASMEARRAQQRLQMDMSMGMGMNVSVGPGNVGVSGVGVGGASVGLNIVMNNVGAGVGVGGGQSVATGADRVPMNIAKVNVTTPSTADASQKRRKQPAHFLCPVPGCGSTFTRHFNLKGTFRLVRESSFLSLSFSLK